MAKKKKAGINKSQAIRDRQNDIGDGLQRLSWETERGGARSAAIYPGGEAGGKRKRSALDGVVVGALKSSATS